MDETLVARVLAMYNIPDYTLLHRQQGYRNHSYVLQCQDRVLNLILYKREPGMAERIRRADRVSNYAARQGLPARRNYDPRLLELRSKSSRRYVALYDYVPGATIPWEAYSMQHLKNLGQMLARLHHALEAFDAQQLPHIEDEVRDLQQEMTDYAAQPGVQTALAAKLGLRLTPPALTELLERLAETPNHQALHMDFVRGNILFAGKDICGILDFEKTASGHPIFDVARTLAFLLVDCKHKSPSAAQRYFLLSGYIKHGAGRLNRLPPQTLDSLVQFYLFHDLYKFLRHNPYESLPENEHFVRTRDILLRTKLANRL